MSEEISSSHLKKKKKEERKRKNNLWLSRIGASDTRSEPLRSSHRPVEAQNPAKFRCASLGRRGERREEPPRHRDSLLILCVRAGQLMELTKSNKIPKTVHCRTLQISEKARGHLQEKLDYPVPSES